MNIDKYELLEKYIGVCICYYKDKNELLEHLEIITDLENIIEIIKDKIIYNEYKNLFNELIEIKNRDIKTNNTNGLTLTNVLKEFKNTLDFYKIDYKKLEDFLFLLNYIDDKEKELNNNINTLLDLVLKTNCESEIKEMALKLQPKIKERLSKTTTKKAKKQKNKTPNKQG